MAVAHDASSESHSGTTGSVSQASFSWTHTPAGTPKGVLVFVMESLDSPTKVTSVTYGGVAMTLVDSAHQAGAKPGRCSAFFLGSGIPTGAQTVVVNRTNDASELYAVCVSATASADTAVAGTVKVESSANLVLSEQNVNDGSPGANSVRYAGVKSGSAAIPTIGSNSTMTQSIDFGTNSAAVAVETTPGQGSRPVGFGNSNSDTQALISLAITEGAASGFGYPQTILVMG